VKEFGTRSLQSRLGFGAVCNQPRASRAREEIGLPFTVTNGHPQPVARSLRSRLSQWPIAQITDSEPRPQGAGWYAERSPLRFFHRPVSERCQSPVLRLRSFEENRQPLPIWVTSFGFPISRIDPKTDKVIQHGIAATLAE